MAKRALSAVAVAVLFSACGGEEATTPPPAAPTATVAAPPPAATPTEAKTAEAPPPPKPTLAEMQKKAITDDVAAWNAHDVKKLTALYSDDAVMASPGMNGMEETKGKAEIEKMFSGLVTGFPDMKLGYSRVFSRGDVVVAEWAASGTNTGDFMGEKATGKKMGFQAVSVMWFDDNGKIKREHAYYDQMTIMSHLGKGDPKMPARAAVDAPTGEPKWITDAENPKAVEAVKNIYTAFEKKDQKLFLDTLTDDAVHADMTMPGEMKGKDNAKKEWAMFTKAFPDMKMSPTNTWGFGDFVVTEVVSSGTFKGNMGPIKATNKSGTMHGVDVSETKDGKLAKTTSYGSGLEFASQYGLLPKPKTAPGGDKKAPAAPAAGGDKKAAPAPAKSEAKPAGSAAAPAKPAAPAASAPAKK
jgi:steroid delta-isomerase-like uncharacterized protein